MPTERDDYLARPYEEWAQCPHVASGRASHDQDPDPTRIWTLVIVLLGPALGLCSFLVEYFFFSQTLFVWSHTFKRWTVTGVALSAVLLTMIISMAKLRGSIAVRWRSVAISLPAGLLFGMLFLLPLARHVGMVWTAVVHEPVEGHVVAAASKRSGGRGCHFRNEFHVGGLDGDSFWCSKEPLPPAVYQATVKLSGAGALVLCGEVPGELATCTAKHSSRP